MAHPHWYTPRPFVDRLRKALGGDIDLDPCAAEPSLDQVHAKIAYLYPERNGLVLAWSGPNGERLRVFANPPYDRQGVRLFADRILDQEPVCARLAVLVPLRPSARWWRDLARRAEVCVILPKRIAFIDGSATPKKGTTGRGELCVFGWRLADADALGGIVVPNIMQRAPAEVRQVQRLLGRRRGHPSCGGHSGAARCSRARRSTVTAPGGAGLQST